MRKPRDYKCANCDRPFKSTQTAPKYCSLSCSAISRNKGRVVSKETREKCSRSLRQYWATEPDLKAANEKKSKSLQKYWVNQPDRKAQIKEIGKNSQRGKRRPKNIYDMSHRTREKIIRRLNLACVKCGWNEEVGDLHHVHGREGHDPHNHSKLSYLCPNDHRLAQRGKIDITVYMTFEQQVGDKWLDVYYG